MVCLGIAMPHSIHPGEYSTGGDIGGTPHESDHDGNPDVFYAKRNGGQPWLNDNWTNADNEWNANNRFVLVRNSLHFSPGPGEFCFCS